MIGFHSVCGTHTRVCACVAPRNQTGRLYWASSEQHLISRNKYKKQYLSDYYTVPT